MKPIHLILFVMILFSSALSAQVEIKSTKNTQVGQCTNNKFPIFQSGTLSGHIPKFPHQHINTSTNHHIIKSSNQPIFK